MSTAGRLASPLPRAPTFHRSSSQSHRRGGLQPGHIPEARRLSVRGVQHAIRT
ncbi:hypothetical protein K443DRAFT_684520 [Laccaria amethystina LaAM-08-1]|uniref:Uncharacterized protein n=1 Tax=Laccaria amethystina LaAM-08-1 TaxID=1095629 RepID=A0A0C9WIT1_9AGAR|nr:hypothetical protein K443DRAFT_684520 [Laccaria amethystina LaAM-08-1]